MKTNFQIWGLESRSRCSNVKSLLQHSQDSHFISHASLGLRTKPIACLVQARCSPSGSRRPGRVSGVSPQCLSFRWSKLPYLALNSHSIQISPQVLLPLILCLNSLFCVDPLDMNFGIFFQDRARIGQKPLFQALFARASWTS